MSKGVLVLNFFICSRQLEELCRITGASYKFCHAVAKQLKEPSFRLMVKLSNYISPMCWFEIATTEDFIEIKKEYKKMKNSGEI